MYIPRPFQIDSEEAKELLKSFSIGQLVTATSHGPMATLVPWVFDDTGNRLIGHLSRANSQWSTPCLGEALIIVDVVNGYVRPNWYATKQETGKVVPTWDYVVIQIRGELVVHDDVSWVKDAVEKLTNRHEKVRTNSWKVDDAPSEYVETQLKAIVGVEFKISSIEAAVKMSQNKSDVDVDGVVQGFESDGRSDLAEWVQKYRKN